MQQNTTRRVVMAIVTDSQPASRAVPEPAPAEGPHVAPRLVYVDQLRVLIVVGVFLIHVCEVFNPWDQWHITNPQRSRVLGEFVVVPASWIMPLFMLLAGMSAWYSLQRRSNRSSRRHIDNHRRRGAATSARRTAPPHRHTSSCTRPTVPIR